MPKFIVPITRDATETTYIDVIADCRAEARDAALQEAQNTPWEFDWVLDDNSSADPYFAGDNDLEAIRNA